jgi:Ca2+-binding RTX toxin-like protein
MPTVIPNANLLNGFLVPANFTTFVLNQGLTVAAPETLSADAAINLQGTGGHRFVIHGTVVAYDQQTGTAFGGGSGNNTYTVSQSGMVLGDIAINTPGGVSISNAGLVEGKSLAIRISSAGPFSTGSNSDILNTGTIRGMVSVQADTVRIANSGLMAVQGGAAIDIQGAGTDIQNSGTIIGDIWGATLSSGDVSIINTGAIAGEIFLDNTAADSITNGGTITGLIRTEGGNDAVSNTGTITGDVLTGAGNDVLLNAGRIVGNVWTGSGNDRVDLRGGTVTGQVNTGSGNDTVIVDDETVILSEFLGGGVDEVISHARSFALAAGFDRLELAGTAIEGNGNAGANTLQGNVFDNLLRGGAGADTIFGGAGRDDLRGGWAADSLSGGADEDTLWGGDGNDTLSGNEDDDLLYGQAGNDALAGDAGDDRIFAGAGNDTVTGGAGLDTMTGGLGSDVFVFAATSESPVEAPDTITDFRSGRDVINLEAAFGGVLLFIGTAAFTGSGQVRYSAVDGGIMVEVDTVSRGSGHEMEIFLAGISQVLASDFVL